MAIYTLVSHIEAFLTKIRVFPPARIFDSCHSAATERSLTGRRDPGHSECPSPARTESGQRVIGVAAIPHDAQTFQVPIASLRRELTVGARCDQLHEENPDIPATRHRWLESRDGAAHNPRCPITRFQPRAWRGLPPRSKPPPPKPQEFAACTTACTTSPVFARSMKNRWAATSGCKRRRFPASQRESSRCCRFPRTRERNVLRYVSSRVRGKMRCLGLSQRRLSPNFAGGEIRNKDGASRGIRTPNHLLTRQLLYRWSYAGTGAGRSVAQGYGRTSCPAAMAPATSPRHTSCPVAMAPTATERRLDANDASRAGYSVTK